MAGGPSSPALVAAAARAGAFAQLAGGYLTADALRTHIEEVQGVGVAGFGVNLFAPVIHPIDAAEYDAYVTQIAADLPRDTPVPPLREDDDSWAAKVALVIEHRVAVVSFTFGLPDDEAIAALGAAGIPWLVTVTTVPEARAAEHAGAIALVVQGAAAGAHSGVWAQDAWPVEQPLAALLAEVREASSLPLVAAGGITRREQVEAALGAGAEAVQVGTAVLLAAEAGTNAAHRAALTDAQFDKTALTRAFTGRPARALVNEFVERHADAPAGYPALHHLTRPMRSAAAASGDLGRLHLWAGEGWRDVREAPVADIVRDLTPTR